MSTVTLKKAADVIEFTLAGNLPGIIDVPGLVNRAGQYLVNLHEWSWLEKIATLTLADEQAWTAFPTDFLRLTVIENPIRDFEGNGVELTTIQIIHDFRKGALAPPVQQYHGAIVPVHPAAGGDVTYRLELWPAPVVASGSSSGAADKQLQIYYGRTWKDLDGDDDIALLDPNCVELFYEILRAYARGTVEEDQGTVYQRLEGIKKSSLFTDARDIDAVRQPTFGHTHNSMTEIAGRRASEFRSGTTDAPA